MKRKAEKQQPAAPISAVAARKARQQQSQAATPANKTPDVESTAEPPSKKARHSPEHEATHRFEKAKPNVQTRRSTRRTEESIDPEKSKKRQEVSSQAREIISNRHKSQESELHAPVDEEDSDVEANDGNDTTSLQGDFEGYESPTDAPKFENFPLCKARLSKKDIVYSDKHTVCVRIKEKMSLTLIGQYDIWVKRGVVSLMGAKLHPSPRVYRVYAPSTHSLPVIKCVSGFDGIAEVEIQSVHSGLHQLKDLSPLYQRIWTGERTSADKLTLKQCGPDARRTFSVLYTTEDDSMGRHLRPLHMDEAWSSAIRKLSQRGKQPRVLVCGPKGSGKSTFSRYFLNHLLSPAPQTETGYSNTDGVAFLDLDPGQPEFSPMGQVYLAHLRSPVFGPPFTHPSLDDSPDGIIIRAHHIGATSPKEDPDHYVLAAMDLMDRYRALLTTYPQCPLIVNYPGWIFGLGLEVATWAVRSLGLSDVLYMSEKGPSEVVEPLALAAHDAKIPLTTVRSQPTDFVTRSSAQLRSMQMQSYFHMSRASEVRDPLWSETPVSRTRPVLVDYAGPQQGIRGIMVMGSQISPDLLHDVLDGAVVAVVAVETDNPIMGQTNVPWPSADRMQESESPEDEMEINGDVPDVNMLDPSPQSLETSIVRTAAEDLPYLFAGAGSSNPLDPKASNTLGLALVRSINIPSRKLELVTPIPTSKIQNAVEQGHGIVLVRGQLDNPNWAISEEYYAAKASEKRHHQVVADAKRNGDVEDGSVSLEELTKTSAVLRERTKRASNVPWMKVVDESRKQQDANRDKSLWKLRKRAYTGSESEME